MDLDFHLQTVRNQLDHFRLEAGKLGEQDLPDLQEICARFESLLKFLEELKKQESRATPRRIGKRIGSLSDLPPELVSQLVTAIDELEEQIRRVINEDFDGAASVDEILVGLYRRFKVLEDRRRLASKLYRMLKDESIFSHEKKGVYTTDEARKGACDDREPEEEEVITPIGEENLGTQPNLN
jgi:hypothetical protein